MESNGEAESSVGVSGKDRRVGLIFDERMCKHYAPDGEDHPECPDRVRVIWERLNSSGLAKRCIILSAKDVEDNHLALVHTKSHIDLIKNISSRNPASRRKKVAAKFNSIYFNEGSTEAASLAAGSVIESAEKVAKGELDSAFAIVRPPGHHAEEGEPMGFCLYNNVGIATSFLLTERRELGINKILIVDWDVHHGNGTQKMFYNDSRVLFFSVHRYDYGTFYPAGHDGSHIMTGEGPGAGHNINVPWEHGRCGDADYLAVWDHILIPVAKEFDPDMIIISAGFDAAIGDPLGGCRISPYGYSIMLDKLMEFAGGKIVMALEGGYNLNSIASSARACVEVLLRDKPPNVVLEAYPFASTWRVIQEVRQELSKYWPVLAVELPEKMIRKTAEIEILSSDSESETENITLAVAEDVQTIEDIIQPFSNLKVNLDSQDHEVATVRPLWRSELSKVDIWYATYGSNMSMPRFRCYIEGGQIEGMTRPCVGSMDKSKPKEIIWKTFPHRLFFARDRTATWGPGGVAFLHPKSNAQEKTYMCLYKITLEQFNDVLLQENISNHDMSHPLFDLTALQTIRTEKSLSVDLVQGGWYHNVVHLGKEEDIPILTMTCSLSDVESFISGKVPINPPCKEYANTLIKGLVEGKQLVEEEASAYIEKASTKPLSMIDSLVNLVWRVGKPRKWVRGEVDEDLATAAGVMASCGRFDENYGEDALAEAGLSPFEPQRMVDPAAVLFVKKRGVDAKGAARGSKRPRAAGRSASPSERGQQLELMGPATTDSRPPTASPPHKPAEIVDLSGGEARPAGPLIQLEDLPFSESISRVARWLKKGVEQMTKLEDEKDRYSEQLTAAKARLGKAKDEVKAVKAELAAQLAKTAKAELEAEKARADVERLGAELKTASKGQGEALRAYTKRLLLSKHFLGLVNELAGLINGNAAMDALEEAAKDFPDLDVSKYGYKRLEGAALFSRYAEVIRGHLGQLPILNELASSAGLLTAEQVAACPIDRDPDLDAAFEALPDESEEGEEEQEAGAEDPGFSKRAEVLKTSGAEEIAEESSSGQPPAPEKEVGDS